MGHNWSRGFVLAQLGHKLWDDRMTRGMLAGSQTTLRSDATVAGIGVHSGSPVTLTLHPAEANTGIVFLRSGPNGQRDRELVADYRSVTATEFATVLGDQAGPAISTTEHVLAALHGLGVDNVVVEVDGPEVPIMDGSAEPFVAAIDQAGIATLAEPRRYIKVLKSVQVGKNGCSGELRPYARGLAHRNRNRIRFPADRPPDLRHGRRAGHVSAASLRGRGRSASCATWRNCGARAMRSAPRFENTVVVAENRVLNAEGVRFPDEFVRHKAVDAIGDLALAGAPLIGAYRSVRGGHKLNHAVLTALMADQSAWTYVEMPETVRRLRGHADLATGAGRPGLRA